MTRRVCYIHVGPHKSGTTSIQWFLQENREELLDRGYFVPESETKRGAHHALAEGFAGLEVGAHRQELVSRSIRAIAETPGAELTARPFTQETLRRGVIPEFLLSIGITSSQFRDHDVRRNEAVGPFTVGVARDVLRSIAKELSWLQAKKCTVELVEYL